MKYKLQDLIDTPHFQNLQDRLNEIYAFPSAIIDNDGNVLTATAWQDEAQKLAALGVSDVLTKPCSGSTLLEAVHRRLSGA